MMEMVSFSKLPDNEQIDQVYCEGIFIGKRVFNNCRILLYQLDSFYVEIRYKEYRKEIKTIIVTKNTHILDAYLEQIDVSFLPDGID